MMNRIAIVALLVLAAVGACAQEVVYRFSPVNQYDINLTAAYWNPIITYVSEKSGVPLQLKIGRTSADTTAFVLAQAKVSDKALPFEPLIPNATTIEAMKEARKGKLPRFATVNDLMADLHAAD